MRFLIQKYPFTIDTLNSIFKANSVPLLDNTTSLENIVLILKQLKKEVRFNVFILLKTLLLTTLYINPNFNTTTANTFIIDLNNWLKNPIVPTTLNKFLALTSVPILRNYNLLYPSKVASYFLNILPEKQPTRALRIKFPFVSPVSFFYFNKQTNFIFLAIFIDKFLEQIRAYFNQIHKIVSATNKNAINPLQAVIQPNIKFIFYGGFFHCDSINNDFKSTKTFHTLIIDTSLHTPIDTIGTLLEEAFAADIVRTLHNIYFNESQYTNRDFSGTETEKGSERANTKIWKYLRPEQIMDEDNPKNTFS